MKYLGEISDPKDMVTKEYVDSHATSYEAGTAGLLAIGTDTVDRVWTAKILHDYMETINPTSTTWLQPTIVNNMVVINSGGYYKNGRNVYVQMQVTTQTDVSANTVTNILSGLPAPYGSLAVLQITIGNKMANYMAQVTTGGIIRIRSEAALGSGAVIHMTGVYTFDNSADASNLVDQGLVGSMVVA